MDFERILWWAVMVGCWWYCWRVNQRAQRSPICNCNEEGSRILASLVMKIDQTRTFVGKTDGFSVTVTRDFTCRGRKFKLTATEVEHEPTN